jgi:DNA-binding NtrC family response regulator
MNAPILVLSRDQNLLFEMGQKLEGQYTLLSCDTIEQLHERLQQQPVSAVVVHLSRETLDGHSPGRFIAELDETVEDAPLLGLLDESSPPRLRKLALKAIDECLEIPVDYQRLRRLLSNQQDVAGDLEGFWQGMPHKELQGRTRSLTTFTPEMFEMMDEIKVAARHNVTVLLIGETGSGKTHLARLIHELSDRREERLCTVACGALPPDLIESELFGYVKGAFTGADRDREGKFAAAGRGTLLLDEIDVLPPDQQAKLLRVIETGEYEPVGCNETHFSQARLVVASNYNLEELVQHGTFRTDLYYRLNILCFRMLPLRQRPWDIEFLARKFAIDHSQAHGIPLRGIEPAFIETLRAYHWPGNVRELENVIRRAVLYCQRGVLTVNDLPSAIRAAGSGLPPEPISLEPTLPAADRALHPAPVGPRPMSRMSPGPMRPAPLPHSAAAIQISSHAANMPAIPQAAGAAAATATERRANSTLEARVRALESRIIEDCLQRNNYRRKETAAELGISRVTLYNKMKKFGLL